MKQKPPLQQRVPQGCNPPTSALSHAAKQSTGAQPALHRPDRGLTHAAGTTQRPPPHATPPHAARQAALARLPAGASANAHGVLLYRHRRVDAPAERWAGIALRHAAKDAAMAPAGLEVRNGERL